MKVTLPDALSSASSELDDTLTLSIVGPTGVGLGVSVGVSVGIGVMDAVLVGVGVSVLVGRGVLVGV